MGRSRGIGHNDTRLPVSATINGALGKTRGQIMQEHYPIGIAELTSRDNDAPAGGLSIDVAGVITTQNQRDQIIPTGSYVMVVPPTWEEIADQTLRPGQGNRANREGRVPWVYEVYRPNQYNFYDDVHVRNVLANDVMVLDNVGNIIPRQGKDAQINAGELLTARQFRECLIELWDYHTELLLMGQNDGNRVKARNTAALFMLTSGVSPAMPTSTVYLKTFLDKGLPISKEVNPATHDSAGIQAAFRGGVEGHLRVHGHMMAQRPIDRLIRKFALMKMAAEDAVFGIAVSGADAGNDFELHMRSWGR